MKSKATFTMPGVMTANPQKFLTSEDVEREEHLSLDKLAKFKVKPRVFHAPRPKECFLDLMQWVVNEYGSSLKVNSNLQTFIHNRIVIDGQFLHFCEEKKIKVECLLKDSLISWKAPSLNERFFAQGVFLVKSKECEFLHCAVFHKGANHEDEVSFFVVCDTSNYEAYISMRNEFDSWIQNRDRGNLHIRIIDGEDIPYTKDNTWEDLFLPEEMKEEIKTLVEGFLASKDFYTKNRIPWKRGMILYGTPGCGKSSIIKTIIAQYPFKPISVSGDINNEGMVEAFSYAETQCPALLYFEDLDSLLEKGVDVSSFLNLMDGISAKNGLLVIATANNIRKLQSNITDRPSRFDRKFEIPVPDLEMSNIYLKKWFGSLIKPAKCKELAQQAVKYAFSYAHLKELYISSMFEALRSNRKAPTEKDINNALNNLIRDKRLLNNTTINTERYFK
jgi:AAA+ superfamily predicted ATPase